MFASLTLSKIVALLLTYKYLLLFPIAVLEGPIITIIAGFLVSLGKMNFFLAYMFVVLGDVVGDFLYYAIGRWGGKPFLVRWGKYLGVKEKHVEKIEKTFLEHSKKTLLFGKFSHAFGLLVLFSAGIAKEDIFEFLWVSTAGTMVKSMALLLVGFYFGYAYTKINTYIDYYVYVVIAAVVIIGVLYFIFNKQAQKFFQDDEE